jgi:hypothetical protein
VLFSFDLIESREEVSSRPDISYLRRVIECPSEVGVIGKSFLDTLYGRWYVGLGQRDDFD